MCNRLTYIGIIKYGRNWELRIYCASSNKHIKYWQNDKAMSIHWAIVTKTLQNLTGELATCKWCRNWPKFTLVSIATWLRPPQIETAQSARPISQYQTASSNGRRSSWSMGSSAPTCRGPRSWWTNCVRGTRAFMMPLWWVLMPACIYTCWN